MVGLDELDHVIVRQTVGGMLPIIYFGVYHLCYNLLLLMLVTLGPSAMISDQNPLCCLEFVGVLDPIYELYAPIIVRNRRSQWLQHGTPKGMDYNLRIPCIHEVLMLCFGALCLDYLNFPKFLLAPFVVGGKDKRCCAKFLLHARTTILGYMPDV